MIHFVIFLNLIRCLEKIINGLSQVKQIFVMKMGEPVPDNQELIMNHVDKIVKSATSKLQA